MRVNSILAILLFFAISCKQKDHKNSAVENISIEPLQSYYSNTFDEAFFKENHYNITSDNKPYYYNSETILSIDHKKYYLRTCDARIINNSLFLQMTDSPFSKKEYDLRIIKPFNSDGRVFLKLYFGGDTIQQVPIFTFLNTVCLFDKSEYKKGDSIKGKLILTALVYPSGADNIKKDTLNIFGLLKTTIQ